MTRTLWKLQPAGNLQISPSTRAKALYSGSIYIYTPRVYILPEDKALALVDGDIPNYIVSQDKIYIYIYGIYIYLILAQNKVWLYKLIPEPEGPH